MRNKSPAKQSIGIDQDIKVISTWIQQYPDICQLIHADAADYLGQYKFDGNELIYADPPYVCSTRRRARVYTFEYTDADHERLLKILMSSPCMVLISGYDNELYNDMLSGWRKETFNAKTWTGIRQEFVWLNFKPPHQLHDAAYLGANFRERQTIKRRQQRLRQRIQDMNSIERNELIEWLMATYDNNPQENS